MMDILAALGAVVVAAIVAWFGGRRSARSAQKLDRLRKEDAAHDRINEADIGIGAADSANVDWMRDYAKRNRK